MWALVARENLDPLWNPGYAAGSYSSVVQLLISNALEMLASQPTLTIPSIQAIIIEYEWWSLVKLDEMIKYVPDITSQYGIESLTTRNMIWQKLE